MATAIMATPMEAIPTAITTGMIFIIVMTIMIVMMEDVMKDTRDGADPHFIGVKKGGEACKITALRARLR